MHSGKILKLNNENHRYDFACIINLITRDISKGTQDILLPEYLNKKTKYEIYKEYSTDDLLNISHTFF